MYLPSKTPLKQVFIFFLFVFLAFLPFKNFIQDLFFLSPGNLLYLSDNKYTKQIEAFKKENLALRLQIKEFEYLKKENEKLRKAFNFGVEKGAVLLGADVAAFAPSSWRKIAALNKGDKDGVKKGLFVVDENGNFLGKIIESKKKFSRLIFVDDPDFTVSVFIGEDGFGLLKGNLVGAKILYVEDGDQIKVGDKVRLKVHSLAALLDIGEVKKIKKNEGSLFWDVDVKVFTKNTFVDKVFIIK